MTMAGGGHQQFFLGRITGSPGLASTAWRSPCG